MVENSDSNPSGAAVIEKQKDLNKEEEIKVLQTLEKQRKESLKNNQKKNWLKIILKLKKKLII